MSVITFPGLGLTLHVNRVAFSLGSFSVYWYGLIIALGFVLALLFASSQAKKFGIRPDDLLDVLIIAAPCSIVGARIYYIIFYRTLFLNADGSLNWKECLNVHNGGLAIYGGIIVAFLVALLFTRRRKIPFLAFADNCVMGIFIGQLVGRWGNFVNVEAYGRETALPWRMGIEKTVNGALHYSEVHPTFLYESLWNLVGVLLLYFLLKKGWRKFDGMFFLLYLAWYGFGRGMIEGLRTDSLYLFGTGIRVSQLLGFASCGAAVILLLWKLRTHPGPEALYVNQPNRNGEEKEHGSDHS